MGVRTNDQREGREGRPAAQSARVAAAAPQPAREFTIRVVRGNGGAAIEVSGAGLADSMTLVPGDWKTVNMFKRTRSAVRSILSSCLHEMMPDLDTDADDAD